MNALQYAEKNIKKMSTELHVLDLAQGIETPLGKLTAESLLDSKILFDRGTPFRNKKIYIDLERGEWSQFSFQGE